MSRPRPELRLPTPVSIAIASIFGAAGVWLGRTALRSAADSTGGYEGYGWLGLLLIAGAALAVAAFALYFARSRFVFWSGFVAVVLLLSL